MGELCMVTASDVLKLTARRLIVSLILNTRASG